jgi:hypothetical protein
VGGEAGLSPVSREARNPCRIESAIPVIDGAISQPSTPAFSPLGGHALGPPQASEGGMWERQSAKGFGG